MASSSIELATQWLGKLLVEVKYLATVNDKVEELQSELEWMQCFLKDADEKQNKNALLRKWVSDIKDSALEAEDIIENYILNVSQKRKNDGSKVLGDLKRLACCCIDAVKLHFVGSDIDALSAKISKMSSRLQTYGVKTSYGKYSTDVLMERKSLAEQRRTYSHVDDQVVGLEECVEDLVGKLCGQQTIVVVHGMGGIGKTTLARTLFNHKPLKEKFDGVAWAYISQQLQLGVICRDILYQLIPENDKEERESVHKLQELQLPGKLCDMLKKKNYLIILDDIWFSKDWKSVEPIFPFTDPSHGSKLLVTTRNPKIFSGPVEDVSYHQVKLLDRDQSWQLLQIKANFSKDDSLDPVKKDFGEKMLDHCNGHPLAIAVLGGILSTKKSREEWISISEDLPYHLQGDDESYSGVYEVLSMSYYDLPYHMKPCFLHLGHFPEDFKIPVDWLYRLWIAEGIISSSQGKIEAKRSLEDIAEAYLNELIQKGMVQVRSRDFEGKIETCCLHDLMRDKCLELNEEENFHQIFDYQACESDHQPGIQNTPREKLRRMTVYVDKKASCPFQKSAMGKIPPLRSLWFIPLAPKNIIKQDCRWIEDICKDFRLLRVFHLEGLHCKGSLPKSIGNLIYLRYLSIRGTFITELPTSIGNLRFLMFLDLRVTRVVIKLPNVFWKMKWLRNLYFPLTDLSREYSDPQGYEIEGNKMLNLDQLIYLEKLEDVDLDRVDVMGLAKLTSMKKLTAACVSKKESLNPFLKSTSIKTLSLKVHAAIIVEDHCILSSCNSLKYLDINAERYDGIVLPMKSEVYPQNLVTLGFWYCRFPEDPMPILEKLPKLKSLSLHICYGGSKLACSEKGFPELEYLNIDGLFRLREWEAEIGCFPKLRRIEIYNSPISMLPCALPPEIWITCNPCVGGIERYGSCEFFKDRV